MIASNAERKKVIYTTLLKTTLLYLILAIISGNSGIFSSYCACIPFLFPIISDNVESSIRITAVKSIICGSVGVTVAAIYMWAVSSFNISGLLFPAVCGFTICIAYSIISKHITLKKRKLIKYFAIVAANLICLL